MAHFNYKLAAAMVVVLTAAYFVNDALKFALMAADPETGRLKGCYTIIEMSLGYQEPSDYIRPGQLLVGSVLLIVGVAYAIMLCVNQRRDRSNVSSIA